MKPIVVQAKDTNTAIKKGLAKLQLNREEVHIKVLQAEEKGFLGIGKKEAIIELTEKKQQKRALVWVEQGEIRVKNTEEEEPVIQIPENIRLLKNSEYVEGKEITVKEEDSLYVELVQPAPVETDWNITMNASKLEATLEITPGHRIIRTLKDCQPARMITLAYHEETIVQNDLTLEAVRDELLEQQVTYGLDDQAIQAAISAEEPNHFVIANGKQPIQGTNGWIEQKVEMEVIDQLVEDNQGRINYREAHVIPTVEQGDIIGTIHEPVSGTNGTTVTGETIEVDPVFPVQVTEGRGVIIVGKKIVANANGRPNMEQKGQTVKAMVMPQLVQEGNISFSVGNIHFHGDVEIKGNIEENMLVEAGGDIRVAQSVYEATVTAAKSIDIRGAVHASNISAGKSNVIIYELGLQLDKVVSEVDNLYQLTTQLLQAPSFQTSNLNQTKLKPLLLTLMQKKCRELPHLVKSYADMVTEQKNYLDDPTWATSATKLKQLFLSVNDQALSIEQLAQFIDELKELKETSQLENEIESMLTITNALNSSLFCSGDVAITGKSCINSKVIAGGKYRSTGVVRGGEIHASQGIELEEAGAISGTKTVLSAPDQQVIKINKVHPGTVIKIGEMQHIFNEEKEHVQARLTKEGYWLFH